MSIPLVLWAAAIKPMLATVDSAVAQRDGLGVCFTAGQRTWSKITTGTIMGGWSLVNRQLYRSLKKYIYFRHIPIIHKRQ
jgi:hypothetical protein